MERGVYILTVRHGGTIRVYKSEAMGRNSTIADSSRTPGIEDAWCVPVNGHSELTVEQVGFVVCVSTGLRVNSTNPTRSTVNSEFRVNPSVLARVRVTLRVNSRG